MSNKGVYNHGIRHWYTRNGYWATRKKNIDFTLKRGNRYNEVRGPGKSPLAWYQDPSYYKSISYRFW